MAAFDRDAALEQQQIREISDNVTRRLLKALDRCRFAPPAVATEIGVAARTVSDIQREIDHLMAAWPPHDPLDIAVLTHVLSSQQHALAMLEELEAKLPEAPQPPPHDPAYAHRALLATARDIEQEALRYAAAPLRPDPYHPAMGLAPGPGFAPMPQPAPAAWAPPRAPAPPPGFQPPPAHGQGAPPPRSPPAKQKKRARADAAPMASALAALRAVLAQPSAVATLTALTVVSVLVLGILTLMPTPDPGRTTWQSTNAAPGKKLDGRLDTAPAGDPAEATQASPIFGLVGTASRDAMEQPYLVVLATRRSTEELQRDYRGFKESYPDLLLNSKARVDRLQGQDRQSWYRLSLIPPQSQGEAKALCRSLKSAGLTGCWIKQVPLN